jgi:hypothetical protein
MTNLQVRRQLPNAPGWRTMAEEDHDARAVVSQHRKGGNATGRVGTVIRISV